MPPDPNSTTRRSARGRLYSVVTRFWPRIAAGFVVLVGLTELTLGGLTADSGLELYLTAWAATTGGLWFLSDRAEKALSGDARASVSAWLALGDLNKSLESIPKQFALLFDRVFGEALWSRRGFNRSCAASLCAVTVVTMTVLALGMDGGSLSAHPG